MQATALSISRLTVRYGPTTALDAADLEIGAGQVHALLGENGAGKSTIVKVLSGLVRPNAGSLAVFGHNVARFEPRYANALGIRTAFQEISLVKDLTVAQNFMLMEEPLNALGYDSREGTRRHGSRAAGAARHQLDRSADRGAPARSSVAAENRDCPRH